MSRYVVAKNDAAFHVWDMNTESLCFGTRCSTYAEACRKAERLNLAHADELERRSRNIVRRMLEATDAADRKVSP